MVRKVKCQCGQCDWCKDFRAKKAQQDARRWAKKGSTVKEQRKEQRKRAKAVCRAEEQVLKDLARKERDSGRKLERAIKRAAKEDWGDSGAPLAKQVRRYEELKGGCKCMQAS